MEQEVSLKGKTGIINQFQSLFPLILNYYIFSLSHARSHVDYYTFHIDKHYSFNTANSYVSVKECWY